MNPDRRPGLPDFLLTGAFAALFVVNIAHHAMWRDEILAWAIAAEARTPLHFIIESQHYDGHPALWHTLLWLAGLAVPGPVALKLVHGAIGLALIGLIGLASPFSRLERALLLGGYFLVFEYTVISRNYGIAVLLALLYARSRTARPAAIIGNAALLALLANTNIYATCLSGALALEYLASRLDRPDRGRLAAGAAIYVAGLALVAITVWPAPDQSREITQPLTLALSPGHLLKTFLRFLDAGLIPLRIPDGFFAFYVREGATMAELLPHLLTAAALLAAMWLIFRRDLPLLGVFALTLVGAAGFGHLVHAIAIRHWGIAWLAFATCLWMARAARPAPGPSLPALAVLALGAAAGAQSLALQWDRPFSMTQATADWIAQSEYRDLPLIGSPDYSSGMVAVLLGREIAMPDCRCTARRPVFSAARDGFTQGALPQALAELAPRGRPALMVLGWPLNTWEIAAIEVSGIGILPVRAFTGSVTDEDYFLYRVLRP